MAEKSTKNHIRYAGIMHADGSVTLFWLWNGKAMSHTLPPEALALTITDDDVNWLTDLANNPQ